MDGKRGLRNITSGIGNQILNMAIALIIPRLVLVNLGSEVNGLIHSISSIFTYLTLLEAGVGKATTQALYKPLAEDNKAEINGIMAATKKFYDRTGFVYLTILILFATIYTFYVPTELPAGIVFTVIILTGATSVLSYFVQGKYRVLMTTEGKGYILTDIGSISQTLTSLAKIALLIWGFGIVEIQSMYLFFSVLQMLFIVYYIRKHYKWLDLNVEPNVQAISQRHYVLLHQVTGMIFNNTDTLLLTIMTNLKTVSVYSMYNTFYSVINTVLNTFSFSFSYAMGQIYHTDQKRFAKVHDVYELYNMSLTFSFMCILNLFILPFMTLYTSGVTDTNYIDKYIPLLFTSYYLLSNGRASSGLVIDFAQHFEQTKWRAIVEASINLTVSIAGIYFLGIYGALLGTVAALLYRANDMIIYANRLMKRSPSITYKRWLINLAIFLAVTFATNRVLPEMHSLWNVILCGAISLVIIVPIFLILNSVLEMKTSRYALEMIKNVRKKAHY